MTWNLFLPFGGAFLAIEGPLQIGHELTKLYHFILRLIGLMAPLPGDHPPHVAHEHWWDGPLLLPWWAVAMGGYSSGCSCTYRASVASRDRSPERSAMRYERRLSRCRPRSSSGRSGTPGEH